MDRTVLDIITTLRSEKQVFLEAVGDFPKSDPFEHGVQVGKYAGLRAALEIIDSVLKDQEAHDANL
jgi:hypothetical protein